MKKRDRTTPSTPLHVQGLVEIKPDHYYLLIVPPDEEEGWREHIDSNMPNEVAGRILICTHLSNVLETQPTSEAEQAMLNAAVRSVRRRAS